MGRNRVAFVCAPVLLSLPFLALGCAISSTDACARRAVQSAGHLEAMERRVRDILESLGDAAPRYRRRAMTRDLALRLPAACPEGWIRLLGDVSVSVPGGAYRDVCWIPNSLLGVFIGPPPFCLQKYAFQTFAIGISYPTNIIKPRLLRVARQLGEKFSVPRKVVDEFVAAWSRADELSVRRAMLNVCGTFEALKKSKDVAGDVERKLFHCAVFSELLKTSAYLGDLRCVQEIGKGRVTVLMASGDENLFSGARDAVYEVFVDGMIVYKIIVHINRRRPGTADRHAGSDVVSEVRRSILKCAFELGAGDGS